MSNGIIQKVFGLVIAFILWISLFPIIRDTFYSRSETLEGSIKNLVLFIGSLFDPETEIILAIIAFIFYFLKKII